MHRRKYVWTVSLLSVTCNKYYKAQTHICIRACPHIEHGQAHVHVQREWPFIKQVTSAVSNAMGGQTRVTRHSHTQNHLTALFRDCPGRPIPEETFTHSHPSWSLNILYRLPPFTTVHNILFVQFMYLTVLFDNLCPGPSLVFLLVLDPQLHTPCTSSPNHHLFFAAHAHTIAACSAVIPMLCHLYLISLLLLTWKSVF